MKTKRLRATANNIYFLGITSVALSWLYGIPGILIGRFAIKLSGSCKSEGGKKTSDDKKASRLRYGVTYAYIGLILSSLFFLSSLLVFILSLFS